MNSTATVRTDLGDAVNEFALNSDQFMGLQILPLYPTRTKSSNFDKITVAEALKPVGELKRAAGGKYATVQHVATSDSYACEEYGLEEPIDDGDRQDLDRSFDTENDVANLIATRLLVAYDARVAAMAFSASVFSGKTAGVSTEWNNSGNPYNDIQDAKLTLLQQLGGIITPGSQVCLAVSEKVRKNIVENSNVKALLAGGQYSERDRVGVVSNERLAAVLGLDAVFASPAQDNGTDVWDDEYALIFVRRTDRLLRSGPQLGRTFQWEQDHSGVYTVETYRDESRRSDIVRVRQFVDEKIFTTAAGYLLSNITT